MGSRASPMDCQSTSPACIEVAGLLYRVTQDELHRSLDARIGPAAILSLDLPPHTGKAMIKCRDANAAQRVITELRARRELSHRGVGLRATLLAEPEGYT